MTAHPDSALSILNGIEKSELKSGPDKARYALLLSMALDKNFVDTTSFDILQPAIDYYLSKGTPDEKLKTYYYQGRIYQNRQDRDNAISSFAKAVDISPMCTDTLCIARSLVAQGILYYDFYDFNGYIDNYLAAGKLYHQVSDTDHELDCLLNALNGAILLRNQTQADSIIRICNQFNSLSEDQMRGFHEYILAHAIRFGTQQDIKTIIDSYQQELLTSENNILYLAFAYNKLRDNDTAMTLLQYVNNCGAPYDSLKYQSILVNVYEDTGRYKEAFDAYCDFSRSMDAINAMKFEQKTKSIQEKLQFELLTQREKQRTTNIIFICIGGLVTTCLGIFILVLLIRRHKDQKELAMQKAIATEAENEKLKSEKEKLSLEAANLALENQNLLLEMDNKSLEAENLSHRVQMLETESETLKSLLESHNEDIPMEVRQAIRIRIEMLNGLFASYITNNEQYEKPYDDWIKALTEDIAEFMNSNRLAFQASHPDFIQYFVDHGLTVDEINYVCLYAIGLRGKEVGNYMKKRSHVNISSAIRKKLGLDKHETNIGIYVRKLLKGQMPKN